MRKSGDSARLHRIGRDAGCFHGSSIDSIYFYGCGRDASLYQFSDRESAIGKEEKNDIMTTSEKETLEVLRSTLESCF